MKDKHLEREVNSVTTDLNNILDILVNKIQILEQEIENLEKQHEQELIVSYYKGYNDAVLDLPKHLVK